MTTYAGGTRVKSGYYVDARSFTFANVERDGGVLPGEAGSRWVRVPVLAVMAAAPALGGLFVVALPFIGFGVTAYALVRAVGGRAREGARELAATVATPGLAPGEAHLAGRPAEGDGSEKPAGDERAEALAREIEEKRTSDGR
jgi:hypothetical protein